MRRKPFLMRSLHASRCVSAGRFLVLNSSMNFPLSVSQNVADCEKHTTTDGLLKRHYTIDGCTVSASTEINTWGKSPPALYVYSDTVPPPAADKLDNTGKWCCFSPISGKMKEGQEAAMTELAEWWPIIKPAVKGGVRCVLKSCWFLCVC